MIRGSQQHVSGKPRGLPQRIIGGLQRYFQAVPGACLGGSATCPAGLYDALSFWGYLQKVSRVSVTFL